MIEEILLSLYRRGFIRKNPENCKKERFEGKLEEFLKRIKEILKERGIKEVVLFSFSDPNPGGEVIFSVEDAIEFVRKSMYLELEPPIPEDFILKDKEENILFYIDHHYRHFWIIYF